MADKKDGIGSEFIKGIGGAVGAAVCLWIASWYEPFWKTFSGFMQLGWRKLMAQSQWPNWSAYLVSLLAAISLLRWAFKAWSSRKDSLSRFHQLNSVGSVWRWNVISSHPIALQAYCPECDMRLVYEETGGRFTNEAQTVVLRCEKCDVVRTSEPGDMKYLNNRVSREIDRLIRTGEWRRHVPDSLPK